MLPNLEEFVSACLRLAAATFVFVFATVISMFFFFIVFFVFLVFFFCFLLCCFRVKQAVLTYINPPRCGAEESPFFGCSRCISLLWPRLVFSIMEKLAV